MQTLLLLPIAATTVFPWMNLVWVILGITLFIFAVAGLGQWSSVTHPASAPKALPVSAPPGAALASDLAHIAPEIAAAISAAVHVTLGASAKVTEVTLQPESGDTYMPVWSLEGRRQIYTSHKVR